MTLGTTDHERDQRLEEPCGFVFISDQGEFQEQFGFTQRPNNDIYAAQRNSTFFEDGTIILKLECTFEVYTSSKKFVLAKIDLHG
jgi:hypothetical protein